MKNYIIIFVLFSIIFGFIKADDINSDSIVAIVNDDIITYREVWNKIKNGVEQLEKSGMSQRQKNEKKKEFFRRALREMIDEKLVLQEAKKYDIKIPDKTVKEQVEKEMKEKGSLANTGEIDVSEFVKTRLTIQKLFQEKTGYSLKDQRRAVIDTFVPPREIKAFYKKNIKQFTKEKKIKTRIITIYYLKAGGKEQAMKLAETVVRELREGADFGEMAKQYSNDPYAKKGGTWPRKEKDGKSVWDFFGKGEALHEAVEDIAFSMKENQVSNPIAVDNFKFCQIVKIEKLMPGKIMPFAEVQQSIREKLRYEKLINSLIRLRIKLRKTSFIWPTDIFEDK